MEEEEMNRKRRRERIWSRKSRKRKIMKRMKDLLPDSLGLKGIIE
jgi:hypothetical protein